MDEESKFNGGSRQMTSNMGSGITVKGCYERDIATTDDLTIIGEDIVSCLTLRKADKVTGCTTGGKLCQLTIVLDYARCTESGKIGKIASGMFESFNWTHL